MPIVPPSDASADADVFALDVTNMAQRSVNGALVTITAQVLKTALTGISAIGLARLLPASDFGLLAIVAPVTGLLYLLSNIGLFEAIIQQPRLNERQITSMFWINVLLGCATTAILILIAPILAWIYKEPRLLTIVLVLSTTITLSSLATLQIAILNRLMLFYQISLIETISLFVGTFSSLSLAWLGWGYWALVISQILSVALTVVLAWMLSPWRPNAFLISSEVKRLLAFGRSISIFNIAAYLNTSFDNMLIGLYLGEYSLGVYDRAWKLAVMPLTQLMAPMNRVALPILSRLLEDPARYRAAFSRILENLLLVCGPGLVAATLSAPVTVPGLLGERWLSMVPVFEWLCVGGLVTPINSAAFWLFISQGRSAEQLVFGLVAILMNLIAYILGLHWGVTGVARASALSAICLQMPFLVFGATRNGPVQLLAMLRPTITPVFAISSTAMFTYFLWAKWHPQGTISIILFFFMAYLICFLVLLFLPPGRRIILEVERTIYTVMKEGFYRLKKRMQ